MVLWGIERSVDERLWLGEDGHLGSLLVQIAGISLSVAGLVLLATRLGPYRRWRATPPGPVVPATDDTTDDTTDAETGAGEGRTAPVASGGPPAGSADAH
jgi:hypothetical protein